MKFPKKKAKKRSTLLRSADDWFSRYIRLRDSNEDGIAKCCTCGKPGFWQNFDCGHHVQRQFALRFNEKNNHAQCYTCNHPLEGNHVKYKEFIIEKYGEQAELLLQAAKGGTRPGRAEFIAVIQEYKKRAHEELEKRNVPDPYWKLKSWRNL